MRTLTTFVALAIILGFGIGAAASETSSPAAGGGSSDLLKRSQAAYNALKSYADIGTIVKEYPGVIDRYKFKTQRALGGQEERAALDLLVPRQCADHHPWQYFRGAVERRFPGAQDQPDPWRRTGNRNRQHTEPSRRGAASTSTDPCGAQGDLLLLRLSLDAQTLRIAADQTDGLRPKSQANRLEPC